MTLRGVGHETLALTSDILVKVVTRLVETKVLPPLPATLHHFTSLETAYRIIDGDNIRLSHAEYSNDQREMAEAKEIICSELTSRSSNPFFGQVLLDYQALALDAYIFCMSSGTQDTLSQWRAYGQDGRGACLTLNAHKVSRLALNTPSFRINPVIYDRAAQAQFVGGILDRAGTSHASGEVNAREATVAALVFATPLMKAPGFEEEKEWRLIFTPPADVQPKLGFHPRRDFLAPYIELAHLWYDLRPRMLAIPTLRATVQTQLPAVTAPPLIPITELMIGPSGHQSLNVRAFTKLFIQAKRETVTILQSRIPYRSLS